MKPAEFSCYTVVLYCSFVFIIDIDTNLVPRAFSLAWGWGGKRPLFAAKYLRHRLKYFHAHTQATIEPPKPPEVAELCYIANGEILAFGTKTAFN